MVPNPSRTSLGLEYFLWHQDEEWGWTDEQWLRRGIDECHRLGLIEPQEVLDGTVVRMEKAYPVYDRTYQDSLKTIRRYLEGIRNLQTIGRNGLHRYNNQDHSMFTAMLTAENIARGTRHDVWSVNVEEEYHEEAVADDNPRVGTRGTGRDAPVIPRHHYGEDHPVNQPNAAR